MREHLGYFCYTAAPACHIYVGAWDIWIEWSDDPSAKPIIYLEVSVYRRLTESGGTYLGNFSHPVGKGRLYYIVEDQLVFGYGDGWQITDIGNLEELKQSMKERLAAWSQGVHK